MTQPAVRPHKYRMFIDEVGNHDLASSRSANERYLSLTGVIFELDYLRAIVEPDLESLKAAHFPTHATKPVILHRRELIDKKPPFDVLKDPVVAKAFDVDLMDLLSRWNYIAITVVIDKADHLARYRQWAHHPYHYCVEILLERFAMEMSRRGAVGDVMAEARGGVEDRALKDAFKGLTARADLQGTPLGTRLTSKELKVQPKSANIAGLQIADMLAHPAWRTYMNQRAGTPQPATFGGRIGAILTASKWRRVAGIVDGRGTKWLP